MKFNYEDHLDKVKIVLEEIWNYMKINNPLQKCDLIIGCGCASLDIPVTCSKLFKDGYAPLILFTGGYGKITKEKYNKTEAEVYQNIAISNGVPEDKILLETNSTNTGDNFRFSKKVILQNKIKCERILIVHNVMSEKRTLSCAKAIFKDKELFITSPDVTYEKYFDNLKNKSYDDFINEVCVIVGDIQRLIIYPQFGWQVVNSVPENIINDYYFLKKLGFDKYILPENKIKELAEKYGTLNNQKVNCFN